MPNRTLRTPVLIGVLNPSICSQALREGQLGDTDGISRQWRNNHFRLSCHKVVWLLSRKKPKWPRGATPRSGG